MEKTTLAIPKSFAQSTRAAYKSFSGAYTKANTAIEHVASAIIELGIADERGIATKLCEAVFGHKIDKSSANREVSLQSQFFYNAYCKAFNKGAYAPKKPREPRAPKTPEPAPQIISDGVNVPDNESAQTGAARVSDIAALLEAMDNNAFMGVLESVAIECALRGIDSADFVTYYNAKASALESCQGKPKATPRRTRAKRAA